MMDIDSDNKKRSTSKAQKQKKTPKATSQFKTNAEDFKKPKTAKILNERREDRLNRTTQLRKNKINDYIMKKRGLLDSDLDDKSLHMSSSSFANQQSLKMSGTNLTGLIDSTIYKLPPKLCALVALNEDVDLDVLMRNFEGVLKEESENKGMNVNCFHRINEVSWTATVPHSMFKGKERITMIKTQREVYSILDICKVADIILFVSSCKRTEYNKWKTDPDKFSHAIDDFGYKMLSMLRAQGLPQHVCVMQDLNVIPDRHKSDIKKLFNRYFESELKPDKVFTFCDQNKDESKSIIRHLCSVSPFQVSLDIRKHRSYMVCEKVNVKDNSELECSGYIRGNTLNIGNYIHITGFGDFLVTNVENDSDPCPVNIHSKENSKMEIESSTDRLTNINTNLNKLPTEKANDHQVEHFGDINSNKPGVIGFPGVNASQTTNTDKILDEVIDFDIDIKDDGEDLSFEEDNIFEEDEEGRISNKHLKKTTLKYRTEDEMEFADEVDTPFDMPARERFYKYRGLASLKQGSWDPLENLPKEYSNIYSFENLRYLYKCAVRKAHEEGMKISGNYVKITLKNFDKTDLNFARSDLPMILSTLLEHERKLCVMHYKVSLNYEFNERVQGKMTVEAQCGFRRILTKPIYSSEIPGGVNDKLKIEKKLEKDKFYIASVYSQLTYSKSPILLLRPDFDNNVVNLVASGEVVDSDSKKIILKRIILTGYPLKIKKKKSVIRFMFFHPNDVLYFKPVGLVTKNGLRGHITESLGTHGHMKCVFNDHIKANDTVCLYLYKRVFPKWLKESWKYKVFYANRPDYKSYYLNEDKEINVNVEIQSQNEKEKEVHSQQNNIIMNLD